MPRHITEFSFYRWRYGLGYGLVGLAVIALLGLALLYVPGGISKAEMASAVHSSNLSIKSFDPATIVDLPYALLQRLGFEIFGITPFSMKLPSFLLGLFSVLGMILLLRQWFHENVAVIVSLLMVTASQFIFISQDGTPGILYIFLPVWLLFLGLKISRDLGGRNVWEFLFMAIAALSLYTPLSVYILVALISATLLHPHLRFIAARVSKQKILIAGFIGLVLMGPLIAGIVLRPSLGLTLLGIPDHMPDLKANGIELLHAFFGFTAARAGGTLQPIYTLPLLLLVALGLSRVFTTKYTARSYSIIIWSVILVPILLINPDKTAITFVPVLLVTAAGVDTLLYRWYRMFPRNPYARIAGLIPITVLVVGMALTGIERYFYTYHYSPVVASYFSNDLQLLLRQLHKKDTYKKTTRVVVSSPELEFYRAVEKFRKDIVVIGTDYATPSERPLLMTRSVSAERRPGEPTEIITSSKTNDADRWYLYSK